MLLNQQNKQQLENKGIDVLDFYFEQVNMTLWPRFTQVFQQQVTCLQSINFKNFRVVEKTFGLRALHTRYADLQVAFYTLYSHFQDNKMLLSRINTLKQEYFKLLHKVEEGQPQLVYLITVYYTIYTHMANAYSSD